MSYHKDKEVNSAVIRLMDALCAWERDTGRRSTFLLIPHERDERIVMVQDGKPFPESYGIIPAQLLKMAEEARYEIFPSIICKEETSLLKLAKDSKEVG